MAQLLVRQLDEAVKEALRRRGRSMEEEARLILVQTAAQEDSSLGTAGLGHRMTALFADVELQEPISEWRGVEAIPASLEA